MGERADLGDEGEAAAPDLADGAAAHEHALAGVGPVDPPDLHLGAVPAPVEDVGLGDPVRGQRALGVLRIDREVGARADFRGGEAALRLVVGAAEGERPVVVGEARAPSRRSARCASTRQAWWCRRRGGPAGRRAATSSPDLHERDRDDRAQPLEVERDVEHVGVEAHRHVEGEAGGDREVRRRAPRRRSRRRSWCRRSSRRPDPAASRRRAISTEPATGFAIVRVQEDAPEA